MKRIKHTFVIPLCLVLATVLLTVPAEASEPTKISSPAPSPGAEDAQVENVDPEEITEQPNDSASGLNLADTAQHGIRPGDVLTIQLIGEKWGGKYTVPPSGQVDFQFIGNVNLLGKTRSELNDTLIDRLEPDYFRDPDLQINFEKFGQISVLVLGAVGEPKHVKLPKNSGVIDAVVEAGNVTKNSERVKMYVFRKHLNGDTSVYFSNYEDYVEGHLEENVPLRENDVVYVRTNFWPHFDTLDEVIHTLGFGLNAIDTLQDINN